MNTPASMYTVKRLAEIAGVSVRTLHHYDEIGLLAPAERSEAGYRLYGRAELLRLQQILLYREMAVPLEEIRRIMAAEDYDRLAALRRHRRALRARVRRLKRLIGTVETTILELEGGQTMLTDKELYAGFEPELIEEVKAESEDRWPEEYREVDRKVRKMSKDAWARIQEEGEVIAANLAGLMNEPVDSAPVQALVRRHHAWIENFYECGAARYAGLAEMYRADERFRAFYDRHAPGLADFLCSAMKHFAESGLA